MGERPNATTLNRINGAKIYSKENCEWASVSLQGYDQKIRSTNNSGKTGVIFSKQANKWKGTITKDNNSIHLGFFESKEDAILARKVAELKYFGFNKE